jgi:cytochrome c oxidase subunit IV
MQTVESGHDASHDHTDDGMVHSHISPFNFYLGIFGVLIFLTLLTVGVSYVHLGALNLAVAIAIASVKAGLVVTFFMHLRYDNKFNAVGFVCGLLFIGVFFAYTMNDTEKRQNELNDVSGNHVYLGEWNDKQAPGGFEPKEEPKAQGSSGGLDGEPMKPADKKPEHH